MGAARGIWAVGNAGVFVRAAQAAWLPPAAGDAMGRSHLIGSAKPYVWHATG